MGSFCFLPLPLYYLLLGKFPSISFLTVDGAGEDKYFIRQTGKVCLGDTNWWSPLGHKLSHFCTAQWAEGSGHALMGFKNQQVPGWTYPPCSRMTMVTKDSLVKWIGLHAWQNVCWTRVESIKGEVGKIKSKVPQIKQDHYADKMKVPTIIQDKKRVARDLESNLGQGGRGKRRNIGK